MRETEVRREALDNLDTPYAAGDHNLGVKLTPISHVVAELKTHQDVSEPNSPLNSQEVTVAGRVVLKRNAGKIVFATIRSLDTDDQLLQILLMPQYLAEKEIQQFKKNVHNGDILYFRGIQGYSSTKELTLFVSQWWMGAKALNEFPKMKKNHETGQLEHELNKETIHENPVLHMLLSADHRKMVKQRSKIIRKVRQFFEEYCNCMEVDTPILSTRAGGAAAAKFSTHANSSDSDLHLRIATELYLKRLVIGGMGNVFEIGKNFRNEGVDATHSPEFTSLEAYLLHNDYRSMASVTNRMFNVLAMASDGFPVEFGERFQEKSFFDLLNEALDKHQVTLSPDSNEDEVLNAYSVMDVPHPEVSMDAHHLMEDLFDEIVVPHLEGAVFIFDYPTGTTPLAYPNGDGTSQKWDLYINGMEVATAYTENNDPIVQRKTLPQDGDFVDDLQYGLPPLAGLGIGIDRLVMVLTGAKHINEVNPFPHTAV